MSVSLLEYVLKLTRYWNNSYFCYLRDDWLKYAIDQIWHLSTLNSTYPLKHFDPQFCDKCWLYWSTERWITWLRLSLVPPGLEFKNLQVLCSFLFVHIYMIVKPFYLNFALLCLSLLKIKEIVHSEIVFSVHIPFQFVLWLALELSDEHIRVEPFQ